MKFYNNTFSSSCIIKGEFWIRFNFLKNKKYDGFRIINTNKKKLMFSERIKITKTIQILNYNFKGLRPFNN